MVHCFSRFCSFSFFRAKANLRMNSAQVFIPFYEWRNWGSVQVTPPEGQVSPVPVGVGPAIVHWQRWMGGWEGEYSDKCLALSFLRMPAKNFLSFGGWCPEGILWRNILQLERVSWLPSCAALLGARRAELRSQPSHSVTLFEGSFWVALNLNCIFSSLSCLWSCFTAVFTSFALELLAPGL